MNILIVVKNDTDTQGVMDDLLAAGHQPTTMQFIPRTIFVEGDEELRLKIKADHRVRSAVDGDDPVMESNAVNQIIHNGQIYYDPSATSNWGLSRIIRRDRPWPKSVPTPFSTFFECARDGTGVDVYVLDGGCQFDHPEFAKPGGGSKVTMMNYGPMSAALPDTPGHGTAVTSCIVGNTVGVARGAEVFFYSVASSRSGGITPSTVISRINDVIAHYNSRSELNRPAIMNMSFEGTGTSSTIGPAVDAAISAGIICIAAAGNGGNNIDSTGVYPAILAGVLPVPATMIDDSIVRVRTWTSSNSRRACIGAPGHFLQLPTSYESDASGWLVWSGTSFAAPYTTGVLACMLQGTDRLTDQKQVRAALSRLWQASTNNKARKPLFHAPWSPPRLLYLDPRSTVPSPEVPQQVEVSDPYYPMVSFLMDMNQPDGSTTVADLGPVGRTTTVSGAVEFQNNALVFSGPGYVTVTDDAEMRVGWGENWCFSVELEVSFDALPSTTQFITSQWQGTSGGRIWAIYLGGSGNLYFVASENGTATTDMVLLPAGQFVLGRKYQIALCQAGGAVYAYVDGQLVASMTPKLGTGSSQGWHDGTRPLALGNPYDTNPVNMRIYRYRFTRGVCRHSAGFIGDFPESWATTCTHGYVGKGPLVWSTSTTTVNVTTPARLQVGDKLIAVLQTGAVAPTPPAGWSLVTSFAAQDGLRRTYIYLRTVEDAAESASVVTFTMGGSVGAGSNLLCTAFREPDLVHSETLLGGLDIIPTDWRAVFPRYDNTSLNKKLVFFVSGFNNAGTGQESFVSLNDGISLLNAPAYSSNTRLRLGFKYLEPGEFIEPLYNLGHIFTWSSSTNPVRMATVVFDTGRNT